jgi:hypothetical protein
MGLGIAQRFRRGGQDEGGAILAGWEADDGHAPRTCRVVLKIDDTFGAVHGS